MAERYEMRDDMPAPPSRYGNARRYGVEDTEADTTDAPDRPTPVPAMLPNAVVCWGLTQDDALDALIELRGGARATSLRGEG